MPADWLDQVVGVAEQVHRDLGLTVPVRLYQAVGDADPLTGDPPWAEYALEATIEGYAGVQVAAEEDVPAARYRVTVWTTQYAISAGDHFRWGDSERRHRVLRADGMLREGGGSRYGAVCLCD